MPLDMGVRVTTHRAQRQGSNPFSPHEGLRMGNMMGKGQETLLRSPQGKRPHAL